MSTESSTDPMEFLKTLWSSMGMPIPGMVTPTLDTDELEKRIKDLKAVEGWLKTNLGMLQMTIQGLEMQHSTLAAMRAMGESGGSPGAGANPFAHPAPWPWNFMQQNADASKPESPPAAESTQAPKDGPRE